ncbi:MAG: hypothetical protein QM771_04530 [Nitrospira sp.]
MMQRWAEPGASIRKSVLFWWILFVVIQMAERVFLLRDALDQETPTAPLLLKTFLVGVRGDFITATFALVLGGLGAGLYALLRQGLGGLRHSPRHFSVSFHPAFHVGCLLAGLLLFVLLCVDMGYYGFNHQHMDFVFLEYIGDLLAPAATTEGTNVQAMQQTSAELEAAGKWAWRLAVFLTVQAAGIGLWCWSFSRAVVPALDRWRPGSGFQAKCVVGRGTGGRRCGFSPFRSLRHSHCADRQHGLLHAGAEPRVVCRRGLAYCSGIAQPHRTAGQYRGDAL